MAGFRLLTDSVREAPPYANLRITQYDCAFWQCISNGSLQTKFFPFTIYIETFSNGVKIGWGIIKKIM